MADFFTFVLQAMFVFIIFWWIGINFFKHSSVISEWWQKRKLHKIANEHKDKVVDIRKVYQEQFGFLETPEYIKKRVSEIKSELAKSRSNSEPIKINALEFIFLVDDLHTDVVKTDQGVYIVSKKNINDLIREQEKDIMHYAKKMREYALKFLPKEGEPLSLEADELMYWVRNGMLKRPKKEDGNKVFSVSPGLQEVCLDLKEDFVNPHYSLAIVSHADFIKIQERSKVLQDEKEMSKDETYDELKEGKLISFSDNTRRMLVSNVVYVYNERGEGWKEDLKGNKIEDDGKPGNSVGSRMGTDDFIKKETSEAIAMSEAAAEEIQMPPHPHSVKIEKSEKKPRKEKTPSLFEEQLKKSSKKEEQRSKKTSQKSDASTKNKDPQESPKMNVETIETGVFSPKVDHPIIDGFIEYLSVQKEEARDEFIKRLTSQAFPFCVLRHENIFYLPVKRLIDVTMEYLSESGQNAFMAEIGERPSKIKDKGLERYLTEINRLDIIQFSHELPRTEHIHFRKEKKQYSVRVIRLTPSAALLKQESVEIEPQKATYWTQGNQDVVINHYEMILKENKDTSRQSSSNEDDSVAKPVFLKKPKKDERRAPKKHFDTPQEEKAKTENPTAENNTVKEANQQSQAGNETVSVKLSKPQGVLAPKEKEAGPSRTQQKMRRDTFLKKFCTDKLLFSENIFSKQMNDCEQEYFTFRINPQDDSEAWLFFRQDAFSKLLYPFLEKEGVEYSESNKFLNNFMRDDNKGDLSLRYLYTVPDKTVIKLKLVSVKVPLAMLDGLMLDIGYRGGYRELELKSNLDAANDMGDMALSQELQYLSDAIKDGKIIDCQKGDR